MKQRDFVIRDAADTDLPAIQALTIAAYSEYASVMSPTSWEGLAEAVGRALETREPGVRRFVAERGGRIIGSVMLFPPSSDAYAGAVEPARWPELRLLAVAEDARGQGVARALVEECIRYSRLSGARALGLHTSGSMASAVRLYERMGFARAPELDFHPEGAERVTAYRLDFDDAG